MFSKVLVATDRVSTVDAPVVSAARLARRHGAHLYLLHVMESASTDNRRLVRHFQTGTEMLADGKYADAIRQTLAESYHQALADIACDIRITIGFPWEEILFWAKMVDSAVILLGPHSSRAKEKGVVRIAGRMGSTVENVITRATCPVCIVKAPAGEEQLAFRRILVATDFSRSCEAAVSFAARLTAWHKSHLTVFHMLPVPPAPKYTRENYAADKTRTHERLASTYNGYLKAIANQYVIRAGALPHLEIVAYAAKEGADLITLGSHTKESAGKWYPGSVVARVSRRSVCPVVVITDPAVLRHWEGLAPHGQQQLERDRLIHVFQRGR